MASKTPINWNIVLIGGLALGGLYYWNKLKTGNTAQNYTSGVSGETISEATQPTIRTDLRQEARTQRTEARQTERTARVQSRTDRVGLRTDRVEARQQERTARVETRQDARTERAINRQQTRITNVATRQTQRTARVQTRVAARQQLRANVVKEVRNITSQVQSRLSNLRRK